MSLNPTELARCTGQPVDRLRSVSSARSDTVRPIADLWYVADEARAFANAGPGPLIVAADQVARPAGHPTSDTVDALKPSHPVKRVTT
jgi:hypothetical protein